MSSTIPAPYALPRGRALPRMPRRLDTVSHGRCARCRKVSLVRHYAGTEQVAVCLACFIGHLDDDFYSNDLPADAEREE